MCKDLLKHVNTGKAVSVTIRGAKVKGRLPVITGTITHDSGAYYIKPDGLPRKAINVEKVVNVKVAPVKQEVEELAFTGSP